MDAIEPNPRAVIGDNAPPAEPTPFEIVEKEIDDLYGECQLWLDGAVVDNQALADGIGNLMAMLRAAETKAEAARVVEKKPHDEVIAEIQARYGKLIADTKGLKGKTTLAIAACKKALQPWLDKLDAELREKARLAREEADRKQREAQEAISAAAPTNLVEVEQAETLIRDAKRAETKANVAERTTATAGGAVGRSVGLRSVWTATMTNDLLAVRHYLTQSPNEMLSFVQALADRDVRAGKRDIPGFEIVEERKAV